MVYIVMGVSGCGKSTVGRMLADGLGLPFYDADAYHPAENVDKMKRSVPLTDEDRAPWLKRLACEIANWNANGGAVLACSALRERYRRVLSGSDAGNALFIHLKGGMDLIQKRMSGREGHFFPPSLLESQFRTLEEPAGGINVPIDETPEEVCALVMKAIGHSRGTEKSPEEDR